MRVNLKIGLTVVTFAFFITLLITSVLLIVKSNGQFLNTGESIDSEIYVFNDMGKVSDTKIEFDSNVIVNSKVLDDVYLKGGLNYLPVIILIVCSVLLIITMTLWFVLRRIYTKQMVRIIHDLQFLDKFTEENVKDKLVAQALKQLKDKFDTHLQDYKRLSSYLTHEQKNAMAILRANLELEQKEDRNLHILDRLTDSIDDILTLSNNTEEKMSEKVDVSLICAEVCDAYRKNYAAISFSFEEENPTVILGKNRWIYRAVSNLVDNAIKYGEEKPIDVSVKHQKGSVVVKIKDQGKGIDSQVHTAIFNHNYRLNGLKQDGYGIGLSVVSHVCDLCQGFVYVENNQENGTTFYLSFPSL